MDEKISVIIPVYNVEDYLERCLDAMVHQTYQNLEVILVDDGSTDGSGRLCDAYAAQDDRIQVIHQTNGGPSMARNAALKVATGEYLAFVDADDHIHREYLDTLYQMILDTKADIAMVHFHPFTEDAQLDRLQGKEQDAELYEMTGIECICNMHLVQDELYVVMWGKLFRRELLEGITFPEGRICEDLAILYRIYDRASKVVYAKEALYHYFRGNTESATYEIKARFYEDVFYALKGEIGYLEEEHPELTDYPKRTYLYWLLDNYRRLWRKGSVQDKATCDELLATYRSIYQSMREHPKEKFFTFFYYAPRIYLFLKKG